MRKLRFNDCDDGKTREFAPGGRFPLGCVCHTKLVPGHTRLLKLCVGRWRGEFFRPPLQFAASPKAKDKQLEAVKPPPLADYELTLFAAIRPGTGNTRNRRVARAACRVSASVAGWL
jgi:hypothetical protein